MKLIINDSNGKCVQSMPLSQFQNLPKISEELSSSKQEKFQANIFAVNETINSHELAKFKQNIEKLNMFKIHLYSNRRESISTGKSLKINSTFINELEIKTKLRTTLSKGKESTLHRGTLRSGDRISSNGDLCVIGDVNPGAIVSAKKNVYVWGKLLGIALAGEDGNKNASIASLYLNPLQLRICGIVAIGPKDKPKNYYPEIAVLEKQTIVIKPYIMAT